MTLWKWSQTAATNASADGSINWAEGQAPSSVNDSARAMMAAVAKYRDDIAGAITTGGSSAAYTVTSNQSFDTLAHLSGQMIAFVPHTTSAGSAGSQITLNVDGLGAKPIRLAPSVEIPSGTLVQGTPYVATYNNSDGAFYLQGFGTNPYQIPLGAMLPYTGSTAPNTAFVLPFGQAISRTTYATYFSLVSTTFGTGDGSTTFNVIDMRGRLPIGQDNMGGSAASRVTTAGSSIDGTTIGANGGGQNVSILQGNLPNVTLGGSVTYAANSSGISYQPGGAGATVVSAMASGGNTSATTTSVSISLGGSGTVLNKMPPGIVVPYILRVI
ncbi:MAG: tail fiber protein [Xanthobacteraceae bacterium]